MGTVLGLFGFSGYRKASAESIELARHWLEKADLVEKLLDGRVIRAVGNSSRTHATCDFSRSPRFS